MNAKTPAWSREFDEPIPLPHGRELRMRADAGRYVTALPPAVQKRAVWQTAAEMLIKAATEQWPIAMRKALNADKPVSTGLRHGGANQPSRQGSIGSCANLVLRSGSDAAGREAALVQDRETPQAATQRPLNGPQ